MTRKTFTRLLSNSPILILLFCLSGLCSASELLVLARQGSSEYQVVVAKDAEQPIPAVAEDFVDLFETITGVRLPIVTDDKPMTKHEIIIGPSKHLDKLSVYVDWERLGREGYVIWTYGNEPRGKYLLLFGGPMRGTLNAVYTFLEDYLGCRWYTPEFSVIPRKPDLCIDLIHEEKVPPLDMRRIYHGNSTDAKWAARRRINCFSAELRWEHVPCDRSTVEKILSHPLYAKALKFASPKVYTADTIPYHTLGEGGTNKGGLLSSELFETHPEYFGLYNGKRDPKITPCLTHPQVFKLVLQSARQWLDVTPGSNIISVSQSDVFYDDFCHCPNCRKQWGKYTYTPTKNPVGEFSYAKVHDGADSSLIRPARDPGKSHEIGATGVQLDFVNRIAKELEKDHPGVMVHTFAYYWSMIPPDNIELNHNVIVDMENLTTCHYHPPGCCEHNEQYKGQWTAINRWTKIASHFWIWTYDNNNYGHREGSFHIRGAWPGFKYLGLEFREYQIAGVDGVMIYAGDWHSDFKRWMRPLGSFIFANILWDPQYDVQAGIGEFIKAYYGAAAQPMQAYIDSTQDQASYFKIPEVPRMKNKWKVMAQMQGFHNGNWADPVPQAVRRWDALFDEAEKKASKDEQDVLKRVKMARIPLQLIALRHLEPNDPVYIKAKDNVMDTARKSGLGEVDLAQLRELALE